MPNQPDPSSRRTSARPFGYLLVAVAATAADVALWVVGFQYTIATGMLVGASCAGVVCWRQALSEERMMARLDRIGAHVDRSALHLGSALDEDALRAHVERLVIEELGARESVHAQGYAQGYVDGIDRRGGASAN